MAAAFAGFDLSDFWADSDYATDAYVDVDVNAILVRSVEKELGYRLPKSYVALMRSQNGGIPRRTCFPTSVATSWADDHVAIEGIGGIGREKDHSLCGSMGSLFMIEEWGYPDFGVCFCTCPSAGHDVIMLDYRTCGPRGEPSVIHVDQECDYHVTPLAATFEAFIRGLVHEDQFARETSSSDRGNELEHDLRIIEHGRFSSAVARLLATAQDLDEPEKRLRTMLCAITKEKGRFSLHDDLASEEVYDFLFALWVRAGGDGSEFVRAYAEMIPFGDGEVQTGGYAPGDIEMWYTRHVYRGRIREDNYGNYRFDPAYEEQVLRPSKRQR